MELLGKEESSSNNVINSYSAPFLPLHFKKFFPNYIKTQFKSYIRFRMKKWKFIIILFVFSISLNAQEIDISAAKVWTGNYELQDPFGIGISLFQKVSKFGFKFEYLCARNQREFYGRVIYGFLEPGQYMDENVRSTSYCKTYDLSIVFPSILKINKFAVGAGAGFCVADFCGKREGQISHVRANLFDEAKIGVFYSILISRHFSSRLPVKLELSFKSRGLLTTLAVTDIEQPFFDVDNIKELKLNIVYVFRK